MIKKFIPYVLIGFCVAAIAGSFFIFKPSNSHSTTHATSAKLTRTPLSAADEGFKLANALNASPPTTNKLIGEVACLKKSSEYACLFIGNSSGTLYCAAYVFTDESSRARIVNFKRLPNATCGL